MDPWSARGKRANPSVAVTAATDFGLQLMEHHPGVRVGLAQRDRSTGLRLIGKNLLLIGAEFIEAPDPFFLQIFQMVGESQSSSLLR